MAIGDCDSAPGCEVAGAACVDSCWAEATPDTWQAVQTACVSDAFCAFGPVTDYCAAPTLAAVQAECLANWKHSENLPNVSIDAACAAAMQGFLQQALGYTTAGAAIGGDGKSLRHNTVGADGGD